MTAFRTKHLLFTIVGLAAAAIIIIIWIAAVRIDRTPAAVSRSAAITNPDVSAGTVLGDTPAPAFTLVDQNGRPTSLRDFRGKVVVLAFVDSHCTTVCPLMTESMTQALRLLGPAASQVQLLGIDANPLATRVADVAAYTRAHHMQGSWRFLTGSLPELTHVWRAYHVYVAAVHNDIDHQPVIVLIDGHGRERTLYFTQMSYEGVLQQAELLAEGISRLLPSHPSVHDIVPLEYIPALEPTDVVRLPGLGKRAESVVLGKGHPHLLLFFAGWLAEDSDVHSGLAALDGYATLARQHGWPTPAAINELATEGSDTVARQAIAHLAARIRTPIVEDAQGRLGDGYGVQDLPWFVLTSSSGRILWHHDGWLSSQRLAAKVGELLHAG
ncbi:MAG: SCO family protein [Steroidobacteraceae bacterium]